MTEDSKPTLEQIQARAESACCHIEESDLSDLDVKGIIGTTADGTVSIEITITPPEGGWAKPTGEQKDD